jgi:hypothetical protein
MSAIKKIEETYLNLFKIVLLLILTVALLAAIGLAVKGWLDTQAQPQRVAPAEKAPPPKVSFEDFLKSLEQTDEPAQASEPASPSVPAAPRVDPMVEMIDKYIANTWSIYDAFQTGCLVEQPITEQDFTSWQGLRDFYRSNFESFGEPFALSQDEFMKTVFPDPRVVQLCVERGSDDGIFGRGLEWPREKWIIATDAADEYNQRELSREQAERSDARIEAGAKRAFGQQMLWAALISFGVFMSLALLLIFSKIESNLRLLHDSNAPSASTTEKS